jgi:hypothetical protein
MIAPQEPRGYQGIEHRIAHVPVKSPEALHLRFREVKTRNFQVLRLNQSKHFGHTRLFCRHLFISQLGELVTS